MWEFGSWFCSVFFFLWLYLHVSQAFAYICAGTAQAFNCCMVNCTIITSRIWFNKETAVTICISFIVYFWAISETLCVLLYLGQAVANLAAGAVGNLQEHHRRGSGAWVSQRGTHLSCLSRGKSSRRSPGQRVMGSSWRVPVADLWLVPTGKWPELPRAQVCASCTWSHTTEASQQQQTWSLKKIERA